MVACVGIWRLCRLVLSPENGNFTDIIHHITVIAKHRQCHAYLTGRLPICLANGSLKIFYNSKLQLCFGFLQ